MDIATYIAHVLLFAIFTTWLSFVVYNIIYYPRKIYMLLPVRLRHWPVFRNLGISNREKTFRELHDRFFTLQEISDAMKNAGLQTAHLIIGIDFTASNEWQGRKSFGGRSLHNISIDPKTGKVNKWNPYQKVIRTIGETLMEFSDDQMIQAFGFGDEITKDHTVFPLMNDNTPCDGIEDVLLRYTRTVASVSLSGPTSFAPIIRKAMEIVRVSRKYHILLVLADGRVDEKQDGETRSAIVEASHYPLSIVLVGIGDGPWDTMHVYDDKLPQRKFDNFQFVEFNGNKKRRNSRDPMTEFAIQALMEIPDQYNAIKALGYLPGNNNIHKTNDNQLSDMRNVRETNV